MANMGNQMSEIFRQLDYQRWITYREGPLGTPRPRSIPAGWRKAAYKSKPTSGYQGYNKSKSVGAANGSPGTISGLPIPESLSEAEGC
jgi:hypothetical protein